MNNNTFTNLMASDHLGYAAEVFDEMRQHNRAMLTPLIDRIGLEESEVEQWRRAARRVYIPFDEGRGLHPQDDRSRGDG